MVKFQKGELGTQKVLDTAMIRREGGTGVRVVVENVDFELMGLAIKLLEFKSDLVRLLR